MIPFPVNGIVKQFRCSECHWAIILDEPFIYSGTAERVEAANLAPGCSGNFEGIGQGFCAVDGIQTKTSQTPVRVLGR
jgi:hypothetical protein